MFSNNQLCHNKFEKLHIQIRRCIFWPQIEIIVVICWATPKIVFLQQFYLLSLSYRTFFSGDADFSYLLWKAIESKYMYIQLCRNHMDLNTHIHMVNACMCVRVLMMSFTPAVGVCGGGGEPVNKSIWNSWYKLDWDCVTLRECNEDHFSHRLKLHLQIIICHLIKYSFLLSHSDDTKVDKTCKVHSWMNCSNIWLL